MTPEPDWEAIAQRKINKGRRDLGKRCFCGMMKVNHTGIEANRCKKAAQTQTVGSIMTSKDIDQMRLTKL